MLGRALGVKEGQGSCQVVSCPRGRCVRTPGKEKAAHSLWGPLQGSLDKVLGILAEVGSHGAAPRHPPPQHIQEGGSVTLTSKR